MTVTQASRLGIVGSGVMATGVAQVAAAAAVEVVLCGRTSASGNAARSSVEKSLRRAVEKGTLHQERVEEILSRITVTTSFSDLGGSDFVLEAVTELQSVKEGVLRQLEPYLGERAVLATNTSSISITRLANSLKSPQRFLGLHFFNPAPVMKLVEVVSGLLTEESAASRASTFVQGLGKVPIPVSNSPGFVVNRMLCPMLNEAFFALAEGIASAEQIDQAMMLGCNHPIGPLALADLIGLDTLLFIMEVLWTETYDPKFRPAPKLREYVDAGLLGRKVGRGVFQYPGRNGGGR